MCGFWHVPHVCFSIPSSMLQRYGTTDTELRVAPERHDASTLLERSRHYQQYIRENFVEQVPTDPAEVNLSISCLFCFLYVVTDCPSQFEDDGLPIADEVMEEQTDTEKTETERTDQETKHAFHTQHAMSVQSEASIGRCTIGFVRYKLLLNNICTLTQLRFLVLFLLMLLLSCTLQTLILDVSSKVFIQP